MKRIDKIRQMSSEELAKGLIMVGNCKFIGHCEGCLLVGSGSCYDSEPEELAKWLEEEVQEDA